MGLNVGDGEMDRVAEAPRIVGGIGADDEYWKYLEQGEFRLPRCTACQRWMWPAHYRCPACGGWDFEWIAVDPRGTIYSWTRTWYPFDRTKERAADLPYVTALVEIPAAGGARVLGILSGDTQRVKIGMKVHGLIQPPSEKAKGYPSICWVLQ
jgi:uncharacterized OB-fold protein